MRQFEIKKNDADQRLDRFVTKVTSHFSPSLMYKFIRKKAIKVNGKRCEASYKLKQGDIVQLYINDEFFPSKDCPAFMTMRPKSLKIVYEDENIMLIDKQPGMLVHEDVNEQHDTLIQHILATLYIRGEYDPACSASFTPALCNRIDKNTGGIVIAAKNAAAGKAMYEIIKTRQIQKFYLALIHGVPAKKEDTLIAYHRKDSAQNKVYIYDTPAPDRREIKTKYRVLEQGENCALVEVELLTGRTHQIRAHLAHIGHPLVGDGKYGVLHKASPFPYRHQALYAYRLRFTLNSQQDHILSYLNGREFSVENVYFENDLKNNKTGEKKRI